MTMDRLENSLRVKVTGKCNRNCFFCHQEGGMEKIAPIQYSDEFKYLVDKLYQDFNIRSIALTGGEPLLHDGLVDFMSSICRDTQITGFSLTTNGTIYKDELFWENIVKLGLYKVNLSISDILTSVDATDSDGKLSIFDNQMRTISILNQLGIEPNINVVVYNDRKYLINLLNKLFSTKNKFGIALLPDLTNSNTFEYSQKVIRDVLDTLHCKKKKLRHRQGTSNTICEYITDTGTILQVKTTKIDGQPKWLHSICENCHNKEKCQEGFYGIRVENTEGKLMVRLCLYKSTADVLMPVDSFFYSNVYEELKQNWNSK